MAHPLKRRCLEKPGTNVTDEQTDRWKNPEDNSICSNGSMDREYFRSYSDVHVHEEMLADTIRTNTYRRAILKNYDLFRGKVVADVGAGTVLLQLRRIAPQGEMLGFSERLLKLNLITLPVFNEKGILSIFAVHAGAKVVYAIEASDMADQLRAVVKENKMEQVISVIHAKVETDLRTFINDSIGTSGNHVTFKDVELPEKVDVIISEWMGYFLLYESMLNSVISARDRWLSKTGVMMPSVATLYMAPLSDEDYEERLAFWSELKDAYKVNMTSMVPFVRKTMARTVNVKTVCPEGIQSHADVIARLDLKTVTVSQLKNIQKEFSFSCFGHSTFHGFAIWFTVDFPQNICLSTSPYEGETHWQQCVIYVDEPVHIEQGTEIKATICITPNPTKTRFLDIHLTVRVGNQKPVTKCYNMNDCIT